MSRFLLACTPAEGHVIPLAAVAEHLVSEGHEVTFLAGHRFAELVGKTGADFVSLPSECDWDDRDQDAAFPDRAGLRRVPQILFDVQHAFCDPMPHQAKAVAEILRQSRVDAIVVDNFFTGVAPLILGSAEERPPIAVCGVIPPTFSSCDTAPFGLGIPPSSSRLGRVRNKALNALIQKVVFAKIQKHANGLLRDSGLPELPTFLLDSVRLADLLLQFTIPAFEYPRSDGPEHLRFVGPVLPKPRGAAVLPDWWEDLSTARKVVLVTQGTLDNGDLDRLIGPTLRGLADQDVLVVATTGGRDPEEIPGPIPANARVERFIPYDALMPHVDVLVTNGGYGGVQFALSHGVPVVAAGDTEDKPEISCRLAWAGAGVNLHTGRPSAARIARAVRRVLARDAYREHAHDLSTQYARYDALSAISDELTRLVARSTAPVLADLSEGVL